MTGEPIAFADKGGSRVGKRRKGLVRGDTTCAWLRADKSNAQYTLQAPTADSQLAGGVAVLLTASWPQSNAVTLLKATPPVAAAARHLSPLTGTGDLVEQPSPGIYSGTCPLALDRKGDRADAPSNFPTLLDKASTATFSQSLDGLILHCHSTYSAPANSDTHDYSYPHKTAGNRVPSFRASQGAKAYLCAPSLGAAPHPPAGLSIQRGLHTPQNAKPD
ncbi:hypothetical protein K491DRAFT_90775 [Lophiostoma macrostomum CBS 122681]|uniref:Uncharacterized protein n=1 Tax=Lophiostoma macrostomum CBS 122681 TaxID=1314788 RepID=A0A6A6SUJ6_9PLEO|nr:hypothetical protein K491DRAFT_90775 [Lophiostoma macrostomum CBS 122681]